MSNISNSETCKENIFSDFFNKHSKGLRDFLLYKFGDVNQAEDVTQDAFITLWQNCADVPIEKAKSYLYTVASNSTLNKIARQKLALNYSKNSNANKMNSENPEFLLEEKQFKDKLLSAIENLNEKQRVAFLMNRVDGKKYYEIAEELSISVKAVEKRIHLALVELRKEFKNFK